MLAIRDVIKGTLYYPWLAMPNPKWDKYQVTVGNLDKDVAKMLNDAGAKVKKDDKFGGYYLVLNNKEPIPAVDSAANPMSEEATKRIGSGTEAMVYISIRPTKYNNVGQHVESVQVLKLCEYNGGKTAVFQPQEGYRVGDAGEPAIQMPKEEASGSLFEDDTFDN